MKSRPRALFLPLGGGLVGLKYKNQETRNNE